ncbi:SRPBCC family protein [Cellulomonas xiejunii]|uniref:SRPBCC family protein n=1 Tax=Cellulomonas xiejunii TaxID=2968083 RepID=A0ABY5KPN6_9CELL|nr:SRPBCC family protein [Cellulomonas xiejunii]MCC2321170.1 SRPBCC family protein [Cellulomonas xiejunii]UUI71760.1 SRPBCC family protein [Cellulomonas xiejunii]
MTTPIYVETHIRASLDRVWDLTQDTQQHPRWDGRFSRITPVEALPTGGYRFRYELRLPLHTLAGTGTSLGERHRPDGTRTSALRFTTPDRLSPLGDGRGYWRYVPTDDGVTFVTGYDYEPGWGRLLDRLVVRPLVGWLTAWSFDRLRLWAEDGVEPERWPLPSVLAVWRPDRPRAGRCLRAPRRGSTGRAVPASGPSVMDDAPTTLDQLEAP